MSNTITEKDLPGAYERAEALRLQHFQTGEIKSSKLKAKDSDRRRKILIDLSLFHGRGQKPRAQGWGAAIQAVLHQERE